MKIAGVGVYVCVSADFAMEEGISRFHYPLSRKKQIDTKSVIAIAVRVLRNYIRC